MNKSISIIFHYEAAALTKPTHSRASAQSIALEAAAEVVRLGSESGYIISATVLDVDGATQIDLQENIGTISVIKPCSGGDGITVSTEPIFDFRPSHKFLKIRDVAPVDGL